MSPSSDATPLVDARDVTLKLASLAGEVNVLRGLSLTIQSNETIGVVGPSGSGKSTLLMAIAGLERVSSGIITVGGRDLAGMNEDQLARMRRETMGIVFQAFHLMPTMTALENVAVPLELLGRKDPFAAAEAELKAVGLGHRLEHYPTQLSGGEQQRVALARAFVSRPKILLADEPTGNLDGETGRGIVELLFGRHEKYGTALMLITHDPALAERCGRVVRMEDGRIVSEGVREGVKGPWPLRGVSGGSAP